MVGGLSFTPSRAEHAFNELAATASIFIYSDCYVEEITRNSRQLVSMTTTAGGELRSDAFIDSTYEVS